MILRINDLHCGVYADAGAFIQGSVIGTLSEGKYLLNCSIGSVSGEIICDDNGSILRRYFVRANQTIAKAVRRYLFHINAV